jgi:hypothetical protein
MLNDKKKHVVDRMCFNKLTPPCCAVAQMKVHGARIDEPAREQRHRLIKP